MAYSAIPDKEPESPDQEEKDRRSYLLIILLLVLLMFICCVASTSWLATFNVIPNRIAQSGLSQLEADYQRWNILARGGNIQVDPLRLATAVWEEKATATAIVFGTNFPELAQQTAAAQPTITPTPTRSSVAEVTDVPVVVNTATPSPTSAPVLTNTPVVISTPTPTATSGPAANADLALSMTDVPDPVTAGQNITHILVVTNNGPETSLGSVVTETLPGGVTFVSATPSQGSCSQAGGTVTCNIGSLSYTASATINIVFTTTAAGTVTGTANVTATTADPDNTNNNASASTTVNAVPTGADLTISKSDAPDPVVAGNDVTYNLTVANGGPNTATGVVLTDTLPGGVTFVSATPSQGSCSQAGGTVTCNLGDIPNGSSASASIVITTTAAGTITNTASVGAATSDPNTGNNSASAATQVDPVPLSADLSVSKADTADPIALGSNAIYNITVDNAGPDDASGVVLTDTLPAGTTFLFASFGCTYNAGPHTVTCNLGNIVSGGSSNVIITVTPGSSGTITNTVSVTSGTADPNAGNNTASETTTVNPPQADLSLAKLDSPDPITVGSTLTYTIIISNNGPDTATGVSLTDTLPADVNYQSASAGCTYNAGPHTVTCNVGTINNGGSNNVVITVIPTVAGNITNSASVTATTTDPNAGNDTASAATTVDPLQADLLVTKSDNLDPITIGDTLTYTITVTNNGPDTATGVSLTDTLPAGVNYQSSSAVCTYNAGPHTVTCPLGVILSGSSYNVMINVVPTVIGSIANTASVTSAIADPDATNNSVTENTLVQNYQADVEVVSLLNGDLLLWPNGSTTWTAVITNNGPDPTTGVAIAQSITPAAALDSQSWTCIPAGGASCTTASGTGPIDQNVDLPVGSTVTFSVNINISILAGGDAGPPHSFTYQVTASGGTATDPDPSNNTLSDIDGYHTVSLVLDWSGSTADMDIAIVDPGGYSINYGSYVSPAVSPTGGSLSGDTNRLCMTPLDPAQESVDYPNGGPTGTYTIQIRYYQTCTWTGPVNWSLSLVVDGVPTVLQSGTINTQPVGITIIWTGPVTVP